MVGFGPLFRRPHHPPPSDGSPQPYAAWVMETLRSLARIRGTVKIWDEDGECYREVGPEDIPAQTLDGRPHPVWTEVVRRAGIKPYDGPRDL